MSCPYTGCNAPEGECSGACLTKDPVALDLAKVEEKTAALEQVFQVVDIGAVMAFYAQAFEPPTGTKIIANEWFLDQFRGKIVFRLTTRKDASGGEQT